MSIQADDSDDRKFRIGVGDAEGRQQILLIFGLSGEILRRIFRDCELVGLIVLAVDNTNTNPREPTNHAHNWNSNLRFDACSYHHIRC